MPRPYVKRYRVTLAWSHGTTRKAMIEKTYEIDVWAHTVYDAKLEALKREFPNYINWYYKMGTLQPWDRPTMFLLPIKALVMLDDRGEEIKHLE